MIGLPQLNFIGDQNGRAQWAYADLFC